MKWKKMTETQTQTLMETFQAKEYPTNEEKYQLAKSLNLTIKKVKNWFNYIRGRKVAKERLNQSEL